MSNQQKSEIDLARDDLMSHIHRCGVLKAEPEHQAEWLNDTVEYLGECYPALNDEQLAELKLIGQRFCQPVIPHGKGNTALSSQGQQDGAEVSSSDEATESTEMAGV